MGFNDCTYLCSSGLHWNKKRPEREQQTIDALAFVELLMNAPIPKIAIENPVGCISTKIDALKYDLPNRKQPSIFSRMNTDTMPASVLVYG